MQGRAGTHSQLHSRIAYDCRPIIFVGNHQTFALDTGIMLEGMVNQAGILPRGLTHPAVFQVSLVGRMQPALQASLCNLLPSALSFACRAACSCLCQLAQWVHQPGRQSACRADVRMSGAAARCTRTATNWLPSTAAAATEVQPAFQRGAKIALWSVAMHAPWCRA